MCNQAKDLHPVHTIPGYAYRSGIELESHNTLNTQVLLDSGL